MNRNVYKKLQMNKFPSKIVILGVGLIGGSIALGLKSHFGTKITILGSCDDSRRTQKAVREGIIDAAINHTDDLPKDTDLIIIATPVRTTVNIIKKLGQNCRLNCLIIDMGSTKKVISETAQNFLAGGASFIGTHPMAGSEMSGFENASVNLFRNKPWIICSPKKVSKSNLQVVKTLISILGANPIRMTAVTHDRLTIRASHIFLTASSLLVNAIAKEKNWPEIAKIASTGFRDTTRLASDNPGMKTDIVMTNRTNFLEVLSKLKDEITSFTQLIRESDDKAILKYFEDAKRVRDDWISTYFN